MIACANFVLFDIDIWMDEKYTDHTVADVVKHKSEFFVSMPQI